METKSESTKRLKAISKRYHKYIINCIDSSGYDLKINLKTDKQKLQFLYSTFLSEFVHEYNLKRYGNLENCFAEWCMGLPSCFNIEFTNYDIINLAKRMGSIPENATEKQEDKILENYWRFIARKTFVLFRKHKITL